MACLSTPLPTHRLVLENMGYIRQRVALHLRPLNRWELFDDVLQEALVGACKAARTYREGAGAKFTTWATLEVDTAIQRAVRQLPNVIVPPRVGYETRAFRDGVRGYRTPLRADASPVLERLGVESDPSERLDEARLCASARVGIARHLPGRDKARRVDVFLRVFFGEVQSDIAVELGVSNQTVSKLVAGVRPAFEAWAAELRAEAG